MKRKFTGVLIIVIAAVLFARPESAEAKGKTFVFGIHFISGGGIGSAQMLDMATIMLNHIQKDQGDTWKIEKLATEEEVKSAFLKGKLDAIWTWPDEAVELESRGAVIYPWITYISAGRDKRAMCLWHIKTANYGKAQSVAGKSLILDVSWPFWVLSLRDYMASQGMDMPLWEIFGGITVSPNMNSAYISVAMGKADFYWDSDDADILLKITSPAVLNKLAHTACTDRIYARAGIVINGKTMKPDYVKRYMDSINRLVQNIDALAKTDPELKRLQQMLRSLKQKIAASGKDEFSRELALLKKAKKNGWTEEAEIIEAQAKNLKPGVPLKVKPPYGFCKKRCAKDKDKVKCAEKCMN